MSMPGFDAVGRPSVGQISNPTATQVPVGWLRPLSEPVRLKPGMTAPRQQVLAYGSYRPVVSFGWFETLSEPPRFKPGLPPREQQFLAMQPAPSPFVATGWYATLALPVRAKPRSPAALSPFIAYQPAPSPFVPTGWYATLSEPVRLKVGLRASLQQAYTAPPRLMPTPSISGVMSALETKDEFLGAGREWNAIDSGSVGVLEVRYPSGAAGVIGSAYSSTVAVAYARISIRIS